MSWRAIPKTEPISDYTKASPLMATVQSISNTIQAGPSATRNRGPLGHRAFRVSRAAGSDPKEQMIAWQRPLLSAGRGMLGSGGEI